MKVARRSPRPPMSMRDRRTLLLCVATRAAKEGRSAFLAVRARWLGRSPGIQRAPLVTSTMPSRLRAVRPSLASGDVDSVAIDDEGVVLLPPWACNWARLAV